MDIFNIGLATDCHLDDDFFELIEKAAHVRGLTTYKIYPDNLDDTLYNIANNTLRFLTFYDRASDTSPQFLRLYSAHTTEQMYYFVDLYKYNVHSNCSSHISGSLLPGCLEFSTHPLPDAALLCHLHKVQLQSRQHHYIKTCSIKYRHTNIH